MHFRVTGLAYYADDAAERREVLRSKVILRKNRKFVCGPSLIVSNQELLSTFKPAE